MQFKSSQRIAILGRTGTGKTHFSRHFFLYQIDRLVIHDLKHELNGLKATYCHKPEDIVWCWNHNRYKIVYQPPPGIDLIEDFNNLCYLVFHKGNYVLWVDEVGSVTSAYNIPQWFSECLRLGRGRNTGVISLSQRPMDIHNTVLSEADYIIAFQLHLKGDRQKVAGIIGEEASKLREIPRYHYLLYDPYEGYSFHKPI